MRPAKPAALVAALSWTLAACSPIGTPETPPTEKNPLDEAPPADPEAVAARGKPPPPVNQEAPDMDFLRDMTRRSAEQAAKCDVPSTAGPRETANVDVTYETSGHVEKVVVHPPHAGTAIGQCMERAFEGAIVTNFKGGSVTINQKVQLARKKDEAGEKKDGGK
jgi:hypothetical protein